MSLVSSCTCAARTSLSLPLFLKPALVVVVLMCPCACPDVCKDTPTHIRTLQRETPRYVSLYVSLRVCAWSGMCPCTCPYACAPGLLVFEKVDAYWYYFTTYFTTYNGRSPRLQLLLIGTVLRVYFTTCVCLVSSSSRKLMSTGTYRLFSNHCTRSCVH